MAPLSPHLATTLAPGQLRNRAHRPNTAAPGQLRDGAGGLHLRRGNRAPSSRRGV